MAGSLDILKIKLKPIPHQIEQKNIAAPEQEEQLTLDSLFLISESFTQLT